MAGIIETRIQKALQPLMIQQKKNFNKIGEAYKDLQEKVKLYVKEEVKKEMDKYKNVKEDKDLV